MSKKEKERGGFSSGKISDGTIRYIIERILVFHSRTFLLNVQQEDLRLPTVKSE
jgi:hypothetical protein